MTTAPVGGPAGRVSIVDVLGSVRIDGGVEQARSRKRLLAALFAEDPSMYLGRYRLGDPIAAGAAGVVYEAYDPELDRIVAIKVVRPGMPGSSGATQRSLADEAHAMARLAHPNVVPVYDVGTIGADDRLPGLRDAVFIVMEKVDGGSLAEWLTTRRTTDEILDVFVAAGRGLAAAHCVGLVHRDFKPANVMVGVDGRVRVTDFGLAVEFAPTRDDETSVVGTPAYMAPEQASGADVDARSDQFSFCVALREALGDRVMPRVRRVLLRGLQRRPEHRHRSMHALLRALVRARARRRWPAVATVFAIGLTVAVVAAASSAQAPEEAGHVAAPSSVGSPSHLARRMLDTVEAHQDAGRHWAALVLAGLAEAAATEEEPSSLQAEVMIRSAELELALGRPEAARTRAAAAFRVAAAARDDAVQAQAAVLLVSITGYHLHETAEARRWARQAESLLVGSVGNAGLKSALHTHLGSVAYADGDLDVAIHEIETALQLREAQLGPDDPSLLVPLNNLGVALSAAGRSQEAQHVHRRALRLAEATLGREHPDYGGTWHNLAMAHLTAGELEDAEYALQQALEALRPALGAHHPRVGHALTGLSRVYAQMGAYDRALAYSRRSLSAWEAVHDVNHPQFALAQAAEAEALFGLGRVEAARAVAEQAVARLERSLGIEHETTQDTQALLRRIRNAAEGIG